MIERKGLNVRRVVILGALICLSLAMACGGGGGPRLSAGLSLEELLPEIVPSRKEVREVFFTYSSGIAVHEERFRTNADVAAKPGIPFDYLGESYEVSESGRVTGYFILYVDAARRGGVSVNVYLDLYLDERSSQDALERLLAGVPGADVLTPEIGDAAFAIKRALSGDKSDCPCELQFRVGRLLASVDTPSYPGPFRQYNGRLDHAQAELAKTLAGRMRAALEVAD